MRWFKAGRPAALVYLLLAVEIGQWIPVPGQSALPFVEAVSWTSRRKLATREEARNLWNHGYNNYMEHAFPLDELGPLSCTGRGPDWENPHNIAKNDVAGNFSLTLIDILDTFVVLGDLPGFNSSVRNVIDWVSFDVNTKPQIFETTIRVMGGLLSAHIFASDTKSDFHLDWYGGELLEMAHDLGNRMLPAFNTPTGIPYSRLNLRHGVPFGESADTCSAGAGSLILEFGTLSRLTGDDRFEKAAYKAFFALWNRKSDIGLIGNTINAWSGKWLHPETTSVGAGIDSFFEYAFKWFILSGDVEFLDVWHESYAAVMRYLRGIDGFWLRTVDMNTGNTLYNTVDSLSAFWPGLQVLAGDVENAIKSHLIYWNLWKRHSGLPEVWDISHMQAVAAAYPLRPEFAESTYYLYRATKDPFYLDVGARILRDLFLRAKVPCGLTGIQDLRNNQRDDRMESFVLSETLKYLYLLFDEENPLHRDDSNFVFTTEGHILTLDSQHTKPISSVRRKLRRVENLTCPAYQAPQVGIMNPEDEIPGIVTGILSRPDIDYARVLVGTANTDGEEDWWSVDGFCEIPASSLYSYDFILSPDGIPVPEDFNPGPHKIQEVQDGYLITNITGIRAHFVSRLDGKGYDIVKLAQYPVRQGQLVYLGDPALLFPAGEIGSYEDGFPLDRPRDVKLHFRVHTESLLSVGHEDTELTVDAYPASFGGKVGSTNLSRKVTLAPGNALGCLPYDTAPGQLEGLMVLVRRGQCTFLEKLVNAVRAGAKGVVVLSDTDIPFNPSAEVEEIEAFANDQIDSAILVAVSQSSAKEVEKLLAIADANLGADVVVSIETYGGTTSDKESSASEHVRRMNEAGLTKILYLNGHPLLNTRLLV